MRKKDKEIKDKKEIEEIIKKAIALRIAMSENNMPYIVPVCFGYKENYLFFHSAPEGKKIDIIKKNNNVAFEIDVDLKLVKDKIGCKWGMEYKSVIGIGKAFFIEDLKEKEEALKIIMKQYSDETFDFNNINNVVVVKIKIEAMTGKKSKYF
ncbi:MAG: pyridoxamine 5'-phosphate oxidase family protein [Deltaproteobacteria bacterium]|nr:pyridoxamine 5'-phosphate oxidase family protein [Deltaproteobacteria bacterium]RLA91445.1 MAG: pyridoxamine 5'-phosphate oxidase family protein [Deltaproteobacteria bacterium]